MKRVHQAVPIVLAQPLEERVDKAASRQRAGQGPESRRRGRVAAAEDDLPGYWFHDGEGGWEYLGKKPK